MHVYAFKLTSNNQVCNLQGHVCIGIYVHNYMISYKWMYTHTYTHTWNLSSAIACTNTHRHLHIRFPDRQTDRQTDTYRLVTSWTCCARDAAFSKPPRSAATAVLLSGVPGSIETAATSCSKVSETVCRYVCMYVCVCVCMYLRVFLRVCECMCACMCLRAFSSAQKWLLCGYCLPVCVHVCVRALRTWMDKKSST